MRVLLLGATGVIGVRLLPHLREAKHEVLAVTRSQSAEEGLRRLAAEPLIADVYDRPRLVAAAARARPDVVVSQLTDLPDDAGLIPERLSANVRMRREGTDNLLAAFRDSGADRLLVQSVAWELPGEAGASVAEMEKAVLDSGGTVLRYGQFYGPDTYHPSEPPDHPRIHIDDAAARTVAHLEADPGIVELVEPSA